MAKITENTLIPIGIAITVIGGGSAWLTTMHQSMSAMAQEIRSVKEERKTLYDSLELIRRDISEIKGELKRIRK